MSDLDSTTGDRRAERRPDGPREFVAAAYDRYADGLYRYALMILADSAAAEDAVHCAFAKLVGLGGRVQAIGSCGDYLRTAVRNECWRMLDQRRRRPGPLEETSQSPLIEPVRTAGVDEDERQRVEAALRSLPPEQREVLYLKIYEGNTFQEIANRLAISINTAASRYRYAMDKLRERLADLAGPRET